MNKTLPQNINGVLFDLDGTLLDTANDLGEALNFVLAKHNMPLVLREHYRPVASDGALGLLTLGFGEQLKTFDYEVLRAEFLSYYQDNIAEHTCLYKGVADLIKQLDQASIPWGIVTNKPEGLTSLLLPHFPELATSQVMVGGDTLAQRKPHPAPLYYASEQMKVSPQNCLYVGDAPRDIEAGNAAGMFSIAAMWGYIIDPNLCQSWQANLLANSPLDISKIIL